MEYNPSLIPASAGIYKLTNLINNKVYIGQSVNLRCRYMTYFTVSRSSIKNNKLRPIIHALRKYGFQNFKFEVLEETENLNEREIYYISFYDSTDMTKGYNLEKGGSGKAHSCNYRTDPNYIKSQRDSHLGKVLSKETIEKRRNTRSKMGLDYRVKCVNDGKIFRSLKECANYYKELLGVSSIHISEVVNGKRKQDHGLIFIKC